MDGWRNSTVTKLFLLIFVSPVLIGLLGIMVPAFGFFPGLDAHGVTLAPFAEFLARPNLGQSIYLTLFTGFTASLASLVCTMILLAGFAGAGARDILAKIAAPLIAVPHSTIAIGILFLLAPSGWLLRLISPELTGLMRPPIWGWVPDPAGWGLILGLMAKEIPFLTLVGIGALATLPVAKMKRVGDSLGYGTFATWAFILLPLVYRQIRLPMAAVLVFSLSVVDMVLILGPTLPPTLAVTIFHGFSDTELSARLPSSAGACLSVILVLAGLLIWRLGETSSGYLLNHMRAGGHRLAKLDRLLRPVAYFALVPMVTGALGLVAALLWSIAGHWRFPDAVPSAVTMRHWLSGSLASSLVLPSLLLAVVATAVAIIVTLFVLVMSQPKTSPPETAQSIRNTHGNMRVIKGVILAPLFVPQIGFLFGLQIWLSWLHLDGSWLTLIWIHALFILPYSWLILAPAYAALDHRFFAVAASLGVPAVTRYSRVMLPLLAYPLANTILIGVAVSITLYLPTLFVSAGRINTLTLEAVALASGGNRSLTGVAAMLQILIPLCCFAVLQTALYIRFRKLSGMRAGSLR